MTGIRPDTPAMNLVVLISGDGSNLQAIIDAIQMGTIPARIAAVISNRADVFGLSRAKQANINTHTILHTDYPDRDSFDQALMKTIDTYAPGLVVLAGFMRILTETFVEHYQGRLMNIHPSLLPKFKGLNTHQRAIEAGEFEHGASVHFVTNELDGGPLIIQAPVPLINGDTVETLAQRVHQVEHLIYPLAIQWFAEQRLSLRDRQVYLDAVPMQPNQKTYHTEIQGESAQT